MRHFVLKALDSTTDAATRKRLKRLEACCVAPLLALKSDGRVGIVPGFCRDRMCPTCQHHRGREVAARVEHAVGRMNAPRFLTLTLRHQTESLTAMLDRLYASFRLLRKTDAWKAHVAGGIGTLEVTLSQTDGCWHAHLHLLVDGSFWKHADIKAEWLRVTGDSEIVWVEAVHDRSKASKYVSTYIGKPADVYSWTDPKVCEYATAMSGRRLVVTFGTFYRAIAATDDCQTKATLVEPLTSVPALLRSLGRDDVYARFARSLLARGGGLLARSVGAHMDPAAPKPTPLAPHEWASLTIALRRVNGDATAWLPELEPRRKWLGRPHTGTARDRCTLRLFDDAGAPTRNAAVR